MKDIIIIGGGPAGNAAALAASRLGAKSVLLVEREAMGGTCTNRGCIPSKFYLSRSERLAASAPGGRVPREEWAALRTHKRSLVQGLSRSMEASCVKAGVEVARGAARLAGAREVLVRDGEGETRRYESTRIVIAAGSEPASLPGISPDGRRVITSTDALDLEGLPASLVVVGSGPVGAELATVYARFGVKVAVVEAAPRLFPQEDPEVDVLFRRIFEREGIDYRVGRAVVGVAEEAGGALVRLEGGDELRAERVLLGVGRSLGTKGIGCEDAGIVTGPRGEIVVDEELRTSREGVWAAGDVTGRMLLAHVAAYQGAFAAHQALGYPHPPVPYRSIPWATFTRPEIASVGLTEEGARRAGVETRSASRPVMESVKARIDRTTEGFFKIVAERETGRVIGGTVVGPHASDMIHILAIAIHANLRIADLKGFVFGHPSISEMISDLVCDLQ